MMTYKSISIRAFSIIVFLLLPEGYPTWCHALKSDENQKKFVQDSLLTVVQESTDIEDKMKALNKLASLNWQKPEETTYQRQLAEMALTVDSMTYFYEAASALGRYYCNANNMDSLQYWNDKVDSLTKIRQETPTAKFEFLNYYCRYYLINGDYELAMNEAVCLQMLSEENHNRQGSISSNEYLGLIYVLIGRDRDAVVAFENALTLLKEKEPKQLSYEIQIISYLLISYLRLDELDKVRATLAYFDHVLQTIEREKNQGLKWGNFPLRDKYAILYSNYINLYVAEKKQPEAREAVRKAASYVEEKRSAYLTSIYDLALARFYFFEKDYAKALDEIDKVLAVDHSIEPLELKINILKDAGKKEDALAVHEELLAFIKQTNITAFTRQIDQLRTLHNLNEKKIQEQKLLMQKDKLSQKQHQLTASLIFSLSLLILFYLLIRYALHTRRLKNALQTERAELLETSDKLRIAKEQAEESNRLKTSFIANMNHEIRTPLNAIVGFSDLLKDAEEEEKQAYIGIIHTNTELLLKLVNDVLELSQLESDSREIILANTEIHHCCTETLKSINWKIPAGVCLQFTYSDAPYMLKTDPQKLQQLLVNLLLNAAKFTEKGNITLDYRVEPAKAQIVFSVTDTGCGISPDKQESIFNCFEKIDEFKQGAGLGLVVCRKIAAYLGGTLTVDPAYTGGARFVFVHPFFQTSPQTSSPSERPDRDAQES